MSTSCRVDNLIPLDVVKYLPSGQGGFLLPSMQEEDSSELGFRTKISGHCHGLLVSDPSARDMRLASGVERTGKECGEKEQAADGQSQRSGGDYMQYGTPDGIPERKN